MTTEILNQVINHPKQLEKMGVEAIKLSHARAAKTIVDTCQLMQK